MGGEEEADDGLVPIAQDGSAVVKPDIASTRISKRDRTSPLVYTVVPGDTVSTIAEEFEISVSTILWENNLSAYSLIRPGDQLTILPQSGLTHKVVKGETLGSLAKKYGVTEDDIITANKLQRESVLAVGEKLFVPGGKKINYPAPATKSYTGISALKDIITLPGTKPVPGNKMNWPTVGNRITQYFSWRHLAIDIANKTGTPIYAADAGTVEYLGWGKGYGNQVVIDHGGGKKTRYAHLSAFSVKNGAKVDKGQAIGAMGSTGWSTGPHLHFEVIINGAKNNPLNYLR
ncbi:MAG: M23 family metallopeptidase [Planctomycetes bacterium]|nr:M23 family metallopeptidase [Planctomycetota bacterium]